MEKSVKILGDTYFRYCQQFGVKESPHLTLLSYIVDYHHDPNIILKTVEKLNTAVDWGILRLDATDYQRFHEAIMKNNQEYEKVISKLLSDFSDYLMAKNHFDDAACYNHICTDCNAWKDIYRLVKPGRISGENLYILISHLHCSGVLKILSRYRESFPFIAECIIVNISKWEEV